MSGTKNVYQIPEDKIVTLTKMNHISEVQCMEKRNFKPTIKKLNDKEYLNLATGEILEFQNRAESRKGNIDSMYRTMKNLRYLINNNFVGAKNELFLTLTYRDYIRDPKTLYKDLDKFYKRLRYKFKDITSIDYLNVSEPRGDGVWHCHILLRFNDLQKIFIPNNELADLWGHGYTKTKSINKVDNIGAYLTAYLTDMELGEIDQEYLEENDIQGYVVKTVKDKKFVKGARLHMYPVGMNIYRCSRGIKKPERINMSYGKAKKYIGDGAPTYFNKVLINNGDFENSIVYEYYNTKRR